MGKKVAAVTGARQGIGRAISIALAQAGFDIAALDLVEDGKVDSLHGEIEALGRGFTFGQLDIADIDAQAAALDQVEQALGPVDALVNNAGIAVRPVTDIMEIGSDMFDRNIAVNLRGTFFLTQAVGKRMLARKSENYRSITFITSIAAGMTSTVRSPYCISKCGLSMAAQIFAQRLGEAGIAVHEIRPGFIRTDMSAQNPSAKIDAYMESGRVPMKRWGAPEDIGQVTASLASGAMPYVSGQPIHVDGGFHIPAS
ncbi:MAG: 3-ketoacyl-ACP reductase [Sphingobium sp.]|nr:MAG: 3-ketoacyl-ACP reductase [Sphingobium sp.]